jgi:hypothetical protein
MSSFDYSRPAELFTVSHFGRRRRMGFRRFDSAALALRSAIEEFPATSLVGAVLQVEEERLDHKAIRRLYDDPEYPLTRNRKNAA